MQGSWASSQRRAVRRAVRTRCQVVSDAGFELLGEQALDLSPRGMLVACDAPAALGEEVLISLLTPGPDPVWLDAEGEITRIVHGYRRGDAGYCIGLHFKYLERSARSELLTRLAGYPPPIPQRRHQPGRTRNRELDALLAELDAVLRQPILTVLRQPIVRVSSARGSCPAGVFSA